MDDKTRLRVVLATFAVLILVGSLELIANGGPALGILAGVGFWTVACLITGSAVNRALYGIESRKLRQ
jgi:hypothetical protein